MLKKLSEEKNSIVGSIPLEFSDDKKMKEGDGGGPAIPDIIHIIPIGQWEHPCYGPIIITPSDIKEFSQNFNAKVRKGVFITAGHEGMQELPAVGWFSETYVRDTGLWGKVEWNESGKEALADKAFKFFSPEFYQTYEDPETRQLFRNVLTGGALTKSPYFKGLEAVVFSEPKQDNSSQSNHMNLQELLAKKLEDLSDAEKAFIKEHKTELTEEQKSAMTSVIDEPETEEAKAAREAKEAADKATADAKAAADANVAAGLNPDGTQKVEASEKVMVSASELSALRTAADKGALAFAELEKNKINAITEKLTFSSSNQNGKFLPKSKDKVSAFVNSLTPGQREAFSTLMSEVSTKLSFEEMGTGSATAGTASAELDSKIAAKMKDGKMTYSEGLRAVLSENPGLEERYDRELTPVKGQVS